MLYLKDMLRATGNILIIFCLFITIYGMRDVINPVATKIGTYVRSVIISLEKEYSPKPFIAEITHEPENEIGTPGPLQVTTTTTTGTSSTSHAELNRVNIVYWTNQARSNNGGYASLIQNTVLDTTALAKTNDMFTNEYFEHISPKGESIKDQVDTAGYQYILIGENLALGQFKTAKEVVDAWMNSPGHRANILNHRYTEIGVGIRKGTYKGDTVWILTQHFGLPKNACPTVDANLKDLILANQLQIDALRSSLDAKKAEIDQSSQMSSNYNTYINQYNELVRQFNTLVTDTKSEIAMYNTQVQTYNLCVQGN